MTKILNFFKNSFQFAWFFVACGFFFAAGIGTFVYYEVFHGDPSELEKSTILARIQEETSIFYLDEKTRIGSFFDVKHRRYIPIDEIPAHVINAIVAAEDKNFYHHQGIDPTAIFKAAMEGLASGKFRRGGSTITQQTVKNIINDWEASFVRKFREMIKALQMERLYSKRQILEFYLNQFHVAGNGNGIGIAAKYYFNKDVSELNIIEAAFIAGSVKGPGKYNPFIKFSKTTRDQALNHADERKNYVLGRMLEQGWVSQEEYNEATTTPIPFSRGEFRTAEVSLATLIKNQIHKEEVLHALNLKSPNDLNIAGLKIYTTLDYGMQQAAQLAMRRNLSRIETILSGFKVEPAASYRPRRDLEVDSFEYGKIIAIEDLPQKKWQLRITFGLPEGTIPYESLMRYAKLLNLPTGNGEAYHLDEIRKNIRVGDILFTQVMSYDKQNNTAILELQKRPEVSGGLISLVKGEVRAVVSGFDTLGFNRAMYAKRQPGSVFKTVAYFAGLQMGWSILDRNDNSRQLFPYQGKFYFPRPDHISPYANTSMLWSGILSENLASVNLGYRLLEKLNYDQFMEVMAKFDLAPKPGEAQADYHYRVSKEIGVTLNTDGIKELQLQNAVADLTPDLIFAGQQSLLENMKHLWWGQGYLGIADELMRTSPTKDFMPENEIALRLELVMNNYTRYLKVYDQLATDWAAIEAAVSLQGAEETFENPALSQILSRFRVLMHPGMRPELGYYFLLPAEQNLVSHAGHSLEPQKGRPLSVLDFMEIWGDKEGEKHLTVDQVKISSMVPASIVKQLAKDVEERFQKVMQDENPYFTYRYFQHHDFRLGLGLYFLKKLVAAMGVYNQVDPVLSFPLGTNDVTANEVAKIFQTFVDGKIYRFYEHGPDNQTNFIKRIEDRDGHVLYEPIVSEHELAKPELVTQMREILAKVVTHGTGRRARGELYFNLDGDNLEEEDPAKNIRIPAFGKTGTTNDYTTSYFAGYMPFPTEVGKPLDVKNSHVISCYIGYDLNKIMRRGRQRMYGSEGALPLWTDYAKKIIEVTKYRDFIDPLDLKVMAHKEWPLATSEQTRTQLVDLPRGLVIRSGSSADAETWQTTKLSRTGEDYQDLYAPGAKVQSLVAVPADPKSPHWQPLRLFAPYDLPKASDEGLSKEEEAGAEQGLEEEIDSAD